MKLKNYFRFGDYPIKEIYRNQLLPVKRDLRPVSWIVLNKPQPGFIVQEYLFYRDKICSIYCFRNPIAMYYSWRSGVDEVRQSGYGHQVTTEEIADWLQIMLWVHIASFAQIYGPSKDLLVSLECFATNTNRGLKSIFAKLAIPPVEEDRLAKLEYCAACGGGLTTQEMQIAGRDRFEEVLVCPRCGKAYIGAGGYNYIRRVAPEALASWKNKEYSDELYKFFERSFDHELMAFYAHERYLPKNGSQEFLELFQRFLEQFPGRQWATQS